MFGTDMDTCFNEYIWTEHWRQTYILLFAYCNYTWSILEVCISKVWKFYCYICIVIMYICKFVRHSMIYKSSLNRRCAYIYIYAHVTWSIYIYDYILCVCFLHGNGQTPKDLAHFQAQLLNSSCLAQHPLLCCCESRCIEHPVFFASKKVQIVSILPETFLFTKQSVMGWKG